MACLRAECSGKFVGKHMTSIDWMDCKIFSKYVAFSGRSTWLIWDDLGLDLVVASFYLESLLRDDGIQGFSLNFYENIIQKI